MSTNPNNKIPLEAVNTIDMLEAIEELIVLNVKFSPTFGHTDYWPPEAKIRRTQLRQLIVDGLRYHSAAKGIISQG